LVVLDGAEEGVVVGGAVGGDLARQEIQVARGGDRAGAGLVIGGEGGVIADYGGCGGGTDDGSGGKMQG